MISGGSDHSNLIPLLRHLANKIRLRPGSIFDRADLVQEAYIALIPAIPRFDPARGNYQLYVTHQAIYAMKNAVRRVEHTGSKKHKQDMEDLEEPAADLGPDPLLAMSVQDVLDSLSPENAEIAKQWLEGPQAETLAMKFGVHQGHIYYAMRRLKEYLRARLRSLVE